jgi:hypothetical protein
MPWSKVGWTGRGLVVRSDKSGVIDTLAPVSTFNITVDGTKTSGKSALGEEISASIGDSAAYPGASLRAWRCLAEMNSLCGDLELSTSFAVFSFELDAKHSMCRSARLSDRDLCSSSTDAVELSVCEFCGVTQKGGPSGSPESRLMPGPADRLFHRRNQRGACKVSTAVCRGLPLLVIGHFLC